MTRARVLSLWTVGRADGVRIMMGVWWDGKPEGGEGDRGGAKRKRASVLRRSSSRFSSRDF